MLPFHLRERPMMEEQPTSHLEVQWVTRIAQVADLTIGRLTSLAIENYLLFKINDLHDVKGSNAQTEIAE
jgi:hypothetical protein